MIARYKRVLSIALLMVTPYLHAQDNSDTDSVAEYFSELTDIGQFNGVILLKRGQTTEILKAYNAKETPEWAKVATTSQFHIASVRKLFNQYLVHQIADDSYANSPLVSFMKAQGLHQSWTPDMLLQHRSGLPRGEKFDFDKTYYTEQELLSLITKQSLVFPPDTDVLYSNFGHLLLDLAHAAWFDLPVNTVATDKIFHPLKLSNTVEINRTQAPVKINGMWFEDNKPKQVDLAFYQRFPTGDVLSTVQDLDTFIRALDAEKIGDDNGVIEHAGAKRGYRSYVYFDSQSDLTFIMLSNHGDMPIVQTINDVKQLLMGNRVALPKRIVRTQGKFDLPIANAITGNYQLLVNQQYLAIECDNQRLFMVETDNKGEQKRTPMFFESKHVLFFAEDSADSLLIKGDKAPFELILTGYGNMEFPMSKLSGGAGCSVKNE